MQERSSCWCSFCHRRWLVAKVTPVHCRSPAYRMLLVPLWCLPKWPSKSQSRPGICATHTRKHTGTEDNLTVGCVVDSSVCSLSELIAVSIIKTSLCSTFRLLRISVRVFCCSPNVSETCHPFPSQIIMLFLLKAHNQFLKQDLPALCGWFTLFQFSLFRPAFLILTSNWDILCQVSIKGDAKMGPLQLEQAGAVLIDNLAPLWWGGRVWYNNYIKSRAKYYLAS